MFTGLIEDLGEVVEYETRGESARITIGHNLDGLQIGESISVSGCCLTALDIAPRRFSADLSPETLKRTNLGDKRPGARVNLERAVRADARLGGHMVQGHVDGIGRVTGFRDQGQGNWWIEIRVPDGLDRYIVEKGSVAIDGISLTVASIRDSVLGVAIIPHTFFVTALHDSHLDHAVNIEVDILAKYVEKLTHGYKV